MASQPNRTESPIAANDGKKPSFKVEDRLSLELVIALVGPVGSGVTTAGSIIKEILDSDYGYKVDYIKVSPIIRERAGEVGESIDDSLQGDQRISKYQTVGNKLRSVKYDSYLADCVIEKIALSRVSSGGFTSDAGAVPVPKQVRLAYIIDSLKNPAEVERLRQIYGDLLWVVTVFAPHDVRESRLCRGDTNSIGAQLVMKKDQEDDEKHGQQVSKTAYLADFFIRNHEDTRGRLKSSIERFLEVLFGVKLHTPTFDEQGMMKAAAVAVQSACLSRQVGAAIYSAKSELIGVGCNDVPKFGGGLYTQSDGEEDKRCFRWGGQVCHNDERKAKLARSIANSISRDMPDEPSVFEKAFTSASNSDARNLIEFSRSVHAEMEAIVSVAREGKGATLGGTLFTTTYPCHNCARHVVAAGIHRVVFIEPYSKSLALDLHSDSISERDELNHVHFQQYEGFAPHATLRVFSSTGRNRKSGGKIIESNPKVAKPLFPTPLDSYINSEGLVIQQLSGE